MLEVGVEYETGLDAVVGAFWNLPAGLRPTRFGHDEDYSSSELIRDFERLRTFVSKSQSGFFLFGQIAKYSIRIISGATIICDCELDQDDEMAIVFLMQMASADPIYGYGCDPAERRHRNRLVTKIQSIAIESWVGRDPKKYVPGLYWVTFLSKHLISRHSLPMAQIEKAAIRKIESESGFIYQFYDTPQQWREVNSVDRLYAEVPRLFNIDKVKGQLLGKKDFIEISNVLNAWS